MAQQSGRHRTTTGAELAVVSEGRGDPVLALHGAYSAHEELRPLLARTLGGHRRVHVDLPGMGGSTAEGIASVRDVVDALEEVVDAELGGRPFHVVGHSLGAHLARALAGRRPAQVRGMALLCPYVPDDCETDPHVVLTDDGSAADLPEALREEFDGYFVVRTSETVARFREAVVPALGRTDEEAVGRWFTGGSEGVVPETAYDGPVLVAVGRHDSFVGHRQHRRLLERYPGATALVVAHAGHALPHEQPELVGAGLRSWVGTVLAS